MWINLLGAEEESRFSRHPDELAVIARSLPSQIKYIIIDEIQKIPKLLDIIHTLIEEKLPVHFIMTGSSARKLKDRKSTRLNSSHSTLSRMPSSA